VEVTRVDRVQIGVSGNVIEITWTERDWLLTRILGVLGFGSITDKFKVSGATRVVELDPDERARLRGALEVWERDLTEGLAKLLAALALAAPV
jgi:hypothetical protein